jgi:hypothetical protein
VLGKVVCVVFFRFHFRVICVVKGSFRFKNYRFFGGGKSANTHFMIFHWFVYLFRDTLLTKAQAKELNVADPEHHWRKILAVGVDDFRGLWGLPPLHLDRIEAMSEIACCHVV